MPVLGWELEADEIVPNLWQGSFPNLLSASENGFKLVVICALEMIQGEEWEENTYHGMQVVAAPFDDTDTPSEFDLNMAHRAANRVVRALKNNQKTLVTCMAGINRSSLVTSLALLQLKEEMFGHEVVKLVKEKREGTFSNSTFSMYVYDQRK